MLTILRHQIVDGLKDSRFLFLAAVVLIAFIVNGMTYADRYHLAYEDWRNSTVGTTRFLEARIDNLQNLVRYFQPMFKPPSALAFIADGGEDNMPNSMYVNAFLYLNPERQNRGNEMLPAFPPVDWVFIVGTVMSLLAIMLGFRAVCGEKRDGTLGLLLSYQVSRLKLFFGKYFGLVSVLIITFIVAVAINLSILHLSGALPITWQVITNIGWSVLISLLFLSLILLFALAISSLVRIPAVALVILLISWLLGIIAVPGLARILGENAVDVPSETDVNRDIQAARSDIWDNAKEGAGSWYSNPEYRFTQAARNRAEVYLAIADARQKIHNRAARARMNQAELIHSIAALSPFGLLNKSLQELSGTGITGFKALNDAAQRYQQQLHSFTVERDRIDPDSPHNIYFGVESGCFSTKPVELSTIPRNHILWPEGGLPRNQQLPWIGLLILVATNLVVMLFAFLALLRYDPR